MEGVPPAVLRHSLGRCGAWDLSTGSFLFPCDPVCAIVLTKNLLYLGSSVFSSRFGSPSPIPPTFLTFLFLLGLGSGMCYFR